MRKKKKSEKGNLNCFCVFQAEASRSISTDLDDILTGMTSHQLFMLSDQLRNQARSLERESVTTLALTMKLITSCSIHTGMTDSEMFGSLDITYQKVIFLKGLSIIVNIKSSVQNILF